MAEHFISYDDAVDDLLAAAAYLGERIKSNDGHAAAMEAVVPRFLARNNVDLAAELANTVYDPFTRDKLLTLVAEKCAEIDDDEYASQLADAIEDDGLRSQAFEHMAIQKVRKGQIDKAIATAESMQHPDFVYAAAAARVAAEGDVARGQDYLKQVEYPDARVSALIAMAVSEFEKGNRDASVDLLDQASQTAKEIEHNEERIRTLCEVGNQYVTVGRNDLAIGAYNTAKEFAEQLDNVHRDSFIAAAVMGFLHAGSMDTADRTLDLVQDKTQVANCLLAFTSYLWNRDEKDDALEALDESYQILRSQREMETRDSKTRFSLFGSIAAQYAGFGKGERAIEIASAIDDEDHRKSALAQLATVFTLRREDEQARHAMNEISDDAYRVSTLVAISDAKERTGDRADAVSILDEAMHLVDEVAQLPARSWAFNEIARRYAELGETARAMSTFDASLVTIRQIRDESSRAVGLATLSDLFINGELELSEENKQVIEKLLGVA
jgi:tetratricopeptide (TPR) repeat protein